MAKGTIKDLSDQVAKQKFAHNKFAADNRLYNRGMHELNKLQAGYLALQNLRVPIKEYHGTPGDVELVMQFKPEAKRKF